MAILRFSLLQPNNPSFSLQLDMKPQQSLVLLLALSHQGVALFKRSKSETTVGDKQSEEKLGGHRGELYTLISRDKWYKS